MYSTRNPQVASVIPFEENFRNSARPCQHCYCRIFACWNVHESTAYRLRPEYMLLYTHFSDPYLLWKGTKCPGSQNKWTRARAEGVQEMYMICWASDVHDMLGLTTWTEPISLGLFWAGGLSVCLYHYVCENHNWQNESLLVSARHCTQPLCPGIRDCSCHGHRTPKWFPARISLSTNWDLSFIFYVARLFLCGTALFSAWLSNASTCPYLLSCAFHQVTKFSLQNTASAWKAASWHVNIASTPVMSKFRLNDELCIARDIQPQRLRRVS